LRGTSGQAGSRRLLIFYEGCHNYHHHFTSFNLDLKTPINLLSRIESLKVHEIPSSCCSMKIPEKIFAAQSTGRVMTPSPCCYYFPNNARPEGGAQVQYFGEILCLSLGIQGLKAAMSPVKGAPFYYALQVCFTPGIPRMVAYVMCIMLQSRNSFCTTGATRHCSSQRTSSKTASIRS
jgi:hypothetical protein